MKSNTTLTIAARCFVLGLLGINLVSSLGCCCKSRGRSSFCNDQSFCQELAQAEHETLTIDEISPNLIDGAQEDAVRQRSGLLVEFRNTLSRSRSRTGAEEVVEYSQIEDTAVEKQIVIEPEQTAVSSAMVQSSRRNVLTSTKPDSITQQKNESSELENKLDRLASKSDRLASSVEPDSKMTLSQLKPVAKFEPASLPAQPVTSSMDSAKSVSATHPAVLEPSTEARTASVERQTDPTHSSAQSESGQEPTLLPRATTRSTQRVATEHQHPDHMNTDSDRSQTVSSVPEGLDQPLALELRDGDWPVYPEVDPVARAYEIRKKSKAQFRDLASQNLVQPSQPSNPTMHMVGHRRRINDATRLDEAALSHDRSNWVPAQKPARENTGLQLRATPRSVPVPMQPIVKMTPSDQLDEAAQTDEQPLRIEFQPREWPRQPNSIDLLPLDDVGPIFDLPTSENVRRLTVRPESEEEEQAIER